MSGVKGRRLALGEAATNKVLLYYKRNAKVRGLSWELTRDEFSDLIHRPCFYCGEPPSRSYDGGGSFYGAVIYNGIDRLNNDLGYFVGNVVPCCTSCNRAKGTMSFQEFLGWVTRVHANIPGVLAPRTIPLRLQRTLQRTCNVRPEPFPTTPAWSVVAGQIHTNKESAGWDNR